MKKRFTMMLAGILLLVLPLNVFGNGEVYPLKNQYPDGIESADPSLFSNSKVEKPIETGFEKIGEIELLLNESQSNQFDVSEDSYSGKFALKVEKRDNEIIPVYETEYFQTGYESLEEPQEEIIQPTSPSGTYNTKCNFYTLNLKPMNDSETISFYVKVKTLNELGNVEEDYALIKSDSDGDGIYSVGEDLSRGRWQTLQLNIADLDEKFQNGAASGLYMNANQNSQWLIDDISSDYRKINEAKLNLSEFASENVVYSQDGLRFAKNKDSEDYNIYSKVVSGGIEVSDRISGVQIDSRLKFASSDSPQQEETKEILYSIPLENDNCAVVNGSEKVQKPKMREVLPSLPSSKEMSISLNSEIEKRYRLLLNSGKQNTQTVRIYTASGEQQVYTLSKNTYVYTNWFDSNITLTSNYNFNTCMDIKAIEYEAIEENSQKDILLGKGGNFTVNLGEFVSNDRTNLTYELNYERADGSTLELLLEFFEGDSSEAYYETKTYISSISGKQIFNNIIPKIRANTKLKITRSATDNTSGNIRFSRIEILKLTDSDWNKTIDYADYEITEKIFDYTGDTAVYKRQPAKNIYSETEEYAVLYPDAEGVVNIGTRNAEFGGASSYNSVYRILNLSEEPAMALVSTTAGTSVSSGTPIYLHYGLADYVITGTNQYFALPPNEKVMFIGKTSYNNKNSDTSSVHYTFVDGLYDGEFVQNGTSIIYSNLYDGGRPYTYNLKTKTNQKLAGDTLICSSPDGTHLLLKENNGKYYILNIETNEKEETPLTDSYRECFFNKKNELFVVNKSLSYYSAGELYTLETDISSSAIFSYDFDSTGEYFLWTLNKTITLYKNTNGIWNVKGTFGADNKITKSALSNDISVTYVCDEVDGVYKVDLNTGTRSKVFTGEIIEITDNNMLLRYQDGYYYLYNPVTNESQKLFNSKLLYGSITYNSKTNMVTGIIPNNRVIYHHVTSEEPEAKYALSFDGRANWYAYTGGRWQNVSKSTIPTDEEISLAGMTASVVNSIPPSAYEKLYSNSTDVLTVDVAIYMYSDSKKRTPVVENIVVKTVEKENLDGLYGIHMEKYNKEDYCKITSLFPVENFGGNAECYYLFYIGNEWLYTYKDNEIVRVNGSADILLSNMSESWIKFKQYGMTAKELRRVPGDVLNELFVNEDFANTEFGVIYVVKTKNEDTSEYVVNFRLGASSDFITNDDIVLELVMNGGDVKIIKSTEFSATDIENLLSWIEARQSGSGEIFYRLSNSNTQHFINYYMINSISVYNGEEYSAQN